MGADARLGSPGISRESARVNAESAVSGTGQMESSGGEELVGSPRSRDDGRDGSGQCHEFGSIGESAIRETTDGSPMEGVHSVPAMATMARVRRMIMHPPYGAVASDPVTSAVPRPLG